MGPPDAHCAKALEHRVADVPKIIKHVFSALPAKKWSSQWLKDIASLMWKCSTKTGNWAQRLVQPDWALTTTPKCTGSAPKYMEVFGRAGGAA
jgi:hypothetical protein